MKSALEKAGDLQTEKTASFGFKDGKIVSLFERYAHLIEGDPVFQKILRAINDGWDKLKIQQRQEILDLVRGLIEVLKDYNRAYTYYKTAAKRQKAEEYQTIKDYQAEVKRADAIENALHNRFIDSINILSRKMKTMGLDNSWRADDEIYGLTPEALRQKAKNWMFRIFGEKI